MSFFGDGANSRLTRLLLESENLPPIDTADPEQVRQRIDSYFEFCARHNLIPQIVGLARWIGISRDTLHTWRTGEFRSKTHQRIVERAYNIIEEIMVERLMNDKIPAPSGIFMLKSMFGFRDRLDVTFESKPAEPFSDLSAEEARERLVSDMLTEATDE